MRWFALGFGAASVLAGLSAWVYCRAADRRMRQLRRRSQQSARLAYLGTLAGGLAHEIKNPLSTLNINLQLLEEDLERGDGSPTRVHSRLEGLRREVSRLQEVLDDFLRFARGHELHLTDEPVNALVDEVLDFIGPEARQHKVNVIRGFAEGLQPCRVDRNLIKQAFLNIVINAQQAMTDGGDLMVRTAAENALIRIDVIDSGPGIPPENLERIWDVYFSTKKGGTGLGLPTARRIIEEHFGSVEVHSDPGKGTCFSVRLPLRPPADAECHVKEPL